MQGNELTIGMDFGVVQVKAGVVFQSHVIDRAAVLPTREFQRPEQLIDAMVGTVEELREKHPRVMALGIGMPGFVDFDRGIVHTMTHVPDWSSVPIRQILEERTGLPVVVDNRANCMTLAEWRCGAARGLRDVVFVNVQTGVGGGIIANGRLVRGSRHGAGEIGQTSIDWLGRAGNYGNRGALERYLGLEEIEAGARAAYAAAGIDKPAEACALGELIHAAHRGDAVAAGVWDAVARMLACALCNTCWLLNPQAVVIGGCVIRAGDLLFTPLREHLCQQLSDPFRDSLMILPAALGAEEAGTIGAAALARERVLAAA